MRALRDIETHEWPGNVAQLEERLEAAIERAIGEGVRAVESQHLFRSSPGTEAQTFQQATREFQRGWSPRSRGMPLERQRGGAATRSHPRASLQPDPGVRLEAGGILSVGPVRYGSFDPERAIAIDGNARVFEAVERETGRRVALKLRPAAALERTRLVREVQALRRLHHPGVARIVADGVEGDIAWIAMELVDGETLRVRMQRGWSAERLGPAWLPLFVQLCEALAHVHENGLAHGDLKPENVMIGRDGRPVLVDFGFAEYLVDPAGRAVLGAALRSAGTPAYMAPELLDGQQPDARSDLWSLGAILHELVTGRAPRRESALDDLGEVSATAPRDVIARLLANDPRERFGHALDVVAALGAGTGREFDTRVSFFAPGFHGRDAFLDWVVERVGRARRGKGTLGFVRGRAAWARRERSPKWSASRRPACA